MKIVITGALGHIGSRLIRDLPVHFPGAELVMIDNLMTQRYCSLFNLPGAARYRFVEADVLTADLSPLLAGADAAIHLAAITDAASSFQKKDLVERNNLQGAARMAQACAQCGVPMIHLSSTSVYGTQKEVVDENCPPEDLKPQSPYAETKLKEESGLQDIAAKDGLKFVVFRFGTICGVSPGMRFHTAVNKFCWQAVMRQPITVWRTALHQKRPYLALEEAVEVIAFAIREKLFENRVFNVLTDNLTVNNILDLIRRDRPDINITFVDQQIMNQLSYEVSDRLIRSRGFHFRGSIGMNVRETIALLGAAWGLP